MGRQGITSEQARAHVAVLDLLLATPAIDLDTERRAQWLRQRLLELSPGAPFSFDLIEAQIAMLCPAEGRRRHAGMRG